MPPSAVEHDFLTEAQPPDDHDEFLKWVDFNLGQLLPPSNDGDDDQGRIQNLFYDPEDPNNNVKTFAPDLAGLNLSPPKIIIGPEDNHHVRTPVPFFPLPDLLRLPPPPPLPTLATAALMPAHLLTPSTLYRDFARAPSQSPDLLGHPFPPSRCRASIPTPSLVTRLPPLRPRDGTWTSDAERYPPPTPPPLQLLAPGPVSSYPPRPFHFINYTIHDREKLLGSVTVCGADRVRLQAQKTRRLERKSS